MGLADYMPCKQQVAQVRGDVWNPTFSWQSHWPWPAGTSAASSASLPSTPACGQHVLTLFSAGGGNEVGEGGEETLHWCAIEEVFRIVCTSFECGLPSFSMCATGLSSGSFIYE